MSHLPHTSVTLSVRVPHEVKDQLESLAQATGRTRSSLAAKAIQYYIMLHAWQTKEIQNTVKKANNKKAKFVDHEKVVAWLNSWGDEDELEPPLSRSQRENFHYT